jgi:hypothetical protein
MEQTTETLATSDPRSPVRKRKMLLVAVSLASGMTITCAACGGIGLYDSGFWHNDLGADAGGLADSNDASSVGN